MTEFELQHRAEKIFKDSKYTFVLCSSTNVDRIAVLHKATLKANKLFICDDYQKDILMYIDSISRSSLYKFRGKVLSYDNNILKLMQDRGFVMLVRYNYISQIVMKQFPKSTFVYSQYEGYLDERFKEYEGLQKFVPKDYTYLHCSGHASMGAIEKIIDTVDPDIVIPIHRYRPSYD